MGYKTPNGNRVPGGTTEWGQEGKWDGPTVGSPNENRMPGGKQRQYAQTRTAQHVLGPILMGNAIWE